MFLSEADPTADTNEIRSQANKAIRKLDAVLPLMPPADALSAISVYDIIHRIAYHTPADRNTVDRYILQAFRSMLGSDKTINQYDLFREITLRLPANRQAYSGKPLQWTMISLREWHRQATIGFDRLRLSDYDIINRVTVLLDSDLAVFEDADENNFKRHLFDATRHHLDNCDKTDWPTLHTLTRFLTAGRQYLPSGEAATIDNRLHTTLLTHPATNRFLRAALTGMACEIGK